MVANDAGEPDISLAVISWLADLVPGDHSEAGLPDASLFARPSGACCSPSATTAATWQPARLTTRVRSLLAQEAMSEDWPLIEATLRHDAPLRTQPAGTSELRFAMTPGPRSRASSTGGPRAPVRS